MQIVRGRAEVSRVAVMADDFPGVKPGMKVAVDDVVKRGQVLFEDRKVPGVVHTAPGAGRVIGVHRGARRALQSVVIELSEGERSLREEDAECVRFERYTGKDADALSREEIVGLLVESGLWTALRTRPFSKVPSPESAPHSLFVTAVDTSPLAPLPDVAIERKREAFERGLRILAKLTDGPTYLCVGEGAGFAEGLDAPVQVETFTGPHPAGTVGLHIHRLDPVSRAKTVWHIGYPDVIAVGGLFATGRLDVERVISIAGPKVADPRLARYQHALDSHQRWWRRIWSRQRQRGFTRTTLTPEFGPDGYQQVDAFSNAPVGDLWEINCWMAQTQRRQFEQWQVTQQ